MQKVIERAVREHSTIREDPSAKLLQVEQFADSFEAIRQVIE